MIVSERLKNRICYFLRFVSDSLFVKTVFRWKIGKRLNLKNPVTYNEKLQWLKLHLRDPIYTLLTDKISVRDYVREKIGEKYLVPIIGTFDAVEDIDFNMLPSRFVLKCTRDSGNVVLCSNKDELDVHQACMKLRESLRFNYYYRNREWPYLNIEPRFICEEYIDTDDSFPPRDFKLLCFNGEPRVLFVASDRGRGTKFDYYDMSWNRLVLKQHYPNSDYVIPKPACFDDMIRCARDLSRGFPHMRVDFYVDKSDSLYVGELTFFHFSGLVPFEPEHFDLEWGSWIDLTTIE